MICSSQHKPVKAPDISEPHLPESCRVIAAYKAVEANETSLMEGMVVRVLCKTPTGKPCLFFPQQKHSHWDTCDSFYYEAVHYVILTFPQHLHPQELS